MRFLRLHWPLLLLAAVVASSAVWPMGGGLLPRLAFGWSAGVALFLLTTAMKVFGAHTVDQIRARAGALDAAGPAILPLAVLAAAASVVVVVGAAAKAPGTANLQALTALATVALSWLFVHVIFALHYAHAFYAPDAKGRDRRGLLFPGDAPPDYQDFLHFAVIIGVAAQTADVQIADKRMRRLSTLHSLIAFVFNTVIVALTVNLAVGLLG